MSTKQWMLGFLTSTQPTSSPLFPDKQPSHPESICGILAGEWRVDWVSDRVADFLVPSVAHRCG
ncbi:hypothetical protein [uncultured Nostoc sp.]|uniref:hypothetical protein n=1 Tax=uncultured Nostoc sp. TaxID=340711 RepID=UPI0035CAB1A2